MNIYGYIYVCIYIYIYIYYIYLCILSYKKIILSIKVKS